MFELTTEMQKYFFDRQKIKKAVDAKTRGAISKSLAYVRTAARSKLRRRKKSSPPGSPPSVHSNNPTVSLKNILFAYDLRTKSGVVGPVKLNQVNLTFQGSKPVPAIHEFGGRVTIAEVSYDGVTWYRRDWRRRRRANQMHRSRVANYRKRPFMAPALEQEVDAGNILSPWANVVSG